MSIASKITLITAAAVCDAGQINASPGAIAVRDGRVVAAGSVETVQRKLRHRLSKLRHGPSPVVETIDLPNQLLLPAMVNAHAHLDLTQVGPQPFDGDFAAWLRYVAAARPALPPPPPRPPPTHTTHHTPSHTPPRDSNAPGHCDNIDAIGDAVRDGVARSRAAGVIYLGDIAASPASVQARFDTGLPGVSFIECFGPGRWQGEYIDRLKQQLANLPHEAPSDSHRYSGRRGPVLGIAPHAPYTTGHDIYAFVARYGRDHALRITTHLAESLDEEQFTRHATGLFVEHLKHYDRYDDSITPSGLHPIDDVADHLRVTPWLLAHCNYVEDPHLTLLAKCRASVAYCPIASDYFGHGQRTPHRYRDMIEAGVNVCLGSDSILCQHPDETQPMGMLTPMRYLYQRDHTDPKTLLRMATINGMIGLGLDPIDATFAPGAAIHINAVTLPHPHTPNHPPHSPTPLRHSATNLLQQIMATDHPINPLVI